MSDVLKVLFGVFIAAVIGIAIMIPVVTDLANNVSVGTGGTAVNESWTGVASLPHTMASTPISSVTYMLIRNGSTATNTVMGNLNTSLLKSLSTNTAWPTGNANLTINCNLTAAETGMVAIGATYISNITYCPVTFTNVSQTLIGDPATTLTFVGTGTEKNNLLYNGTAIANGSGTHTITRTYTPKTSVNMNVTINSTLIDSESIQVYINGSSLGNVSGGTDIWNTASWNLANPANLTYVNTLWMKTMLSANSTVQNANGSIYDNVVIPTKACASSPGVNVTITYDMNAGENITYRFEGHAMGNLTGSPQTFDPDPGWECDLASLTTIRSSFETTDVGHLTKTNITGVNISYDRWTNASTVTGAAVRYAYQAYDSNFTNASLQYSRYDTYGSYTLDGTAGTITPLMAGTFLTTYVYGAAGSALVVTIIGILPILVTILVLIIIAFAVMRVG